MVPPEINWQFPKAESLRQRTWQTMFCEQSKIQYLLSARKNTGTPNNVEIGEIVRTMDAQSCGNQKPKLSLKVYIYIYFHQLTYIYF